MAISGHAVQAAFLIRIHRRVEPVVFDRYFHRPLFPTEDPVFLPAPEKDISMQKLSYTEIFPRKQQDVTVSES